MRLNRCGDICLGLMRGGLVWAGSPVPMQPTVVPPCAFLALVQHTFCFAEVVYLTVSNLLLNCCELDHTCCLTQARLETCQQPPKIFCGKDARGSENLSSSYYTVLHAHDENIFLYEACTHLLHETKTCTNGCAWGGGALFRWRHLTSCTLQGEC